MHAADDDAWYESSAWPDRAIAQLAERQRTMITTAQLRGLGVVARTITMAHKRGRLHRVHVGVYSLVPRRARPPLAAEQAALLAYGSGAVLSHHSAAKLHDRRRPGTPRIRALLDPDLPSAETWSRAEARLLQAISRAGLPAPEANVAFGAYVPDLLWREQRVIVEYDSYDFHSGPGVFHNDRTRHNELTVYGRHQVLHVTRRQVHHELERVLVWIAVALARSSGG